MKKIIMTILIVLLSVSIANAAIIYVSNYGDGTCSQPNVQAAIDASSTGDTVVIPSGSCTWTLPIAIPTGKTITLKGAGYENTVITFSTTTVGINMNESGSRITAIGFVYSSGYWMIDVKGSGWRIDHCRFYNGGGGGLTAIHPNGYNVTSYPTGVIDSNIFDTCGVVVNNGGDFNRMSLIWDDPLNLGTDDAVYVEDCTFTRSDGTRHNCMDGNRSAKTVFRFNTVADGHIEAHSLQVDRERAYRKWEIYGNTTHSSSGLYLPVRLIGGTGVVFNNKISGEWNQRVINFYNRRSYESIGVAGLCDGSSTWDGNQDATGWPCRDQIGRSVDEWLFDKANSPYPPQESVPAYLWLNRDLGLSGGSSDIANVLVNNNSENHIKPNRDYYNEVAIFDGTSGVGVGTLANRPSSCTPGVAYWATDQGEWNSINPGADGQLYKCTATDTWTLYYTPYTYPHPLSKPYPPQNVVITN